MLRECLQHNVRNDFESLKACKHALRSVAFASHLGSFLPQMHIHVFSCNLLLLNVLEAVLLLCISPLVDMFIHEYFYQCMCVCVCSALVDMFMHEYFYQCMFFVVVCLVAVILIAVTVHKVKAQHSHILLLLIYYISVIRLTR